MASFASGKFAKRATAQSLAREFGPQGIHVAHAVIDGVIDIPRTHGWPINGGVPDGKINSDAVSFSFKDIEWQTKLMLTEFRLLIPTGICIHNLGLTSHRN